MSKSSRDGWNSMPGQPRECVCGRRVTFKETLWLRRYPVPQTFGMCCWGKA